MKKPKNQSKIAKERIEKLLKLAEEQAKHPERSKRQIELARKIGLRYNIRFTKGQKQRFCKKCNQILIPGRTCSVRLDSEKKLLTIKCLDCGNIYKYPYKKK